MIKAVIIEDEHLAIDRLTSMVNLLSVDIDIKAASMTGQSAIKSCRQYEPELVFLDIHLPDMTGFEVVRSLEYQPYVIFTTAYAEYAIQAFETRAVDYLVKPYSQEQLESAIDKYISLSEDQKKVPNIDWQELSDVFSKRKERTSIAIKHGDKIKLIDLDKIVYFEADNKYAKITINDGTQLFCDQSLKELETKLNASFIRIHRSAIINTDHIKEITKGFKSRYTFHMKYNNVPSIRSGASYAAGIIDRFDL